MDFPPFADVSHPYACEWSNTDVPIRPQMAPAEPTLGIPVLEVAIAIQPAQAGESSGGQSH